MPITLATSDTARLDWHTLATRARPTPPCNEQADARDLGFLSLQAAYRGAGGIARGDDVAVQLSMVSERGYVDLARCIVAGQVFSFHWHDSFWLPMFQFDPQTMTLREAPRRVLDELSGVLDGWAVAHWHVQPCAALDHRRPLDLLDGELPAVLDAARATRSALGH